MLKKIYLARYQGFCMGVNRAINVAEDTAAKAKGRVTILNEIVHNEAVVEKFRRQDVGQAFAVDEVSDGTLIISAHGVSPEVIAQARAKGLKVVDATCPLVSRIYDIINEAVSDGCHVIHYGDTDHDETAGIVGHASEHITVAGSHEQLLSLPEWKDRKLGLTVQTTAHKDEFAAVVRLAKEKWPGIRIFDTICNATTQRQAAILELAPKVDLILVVGSQTSANSKRLARISESVCARAFLIGTAAEIDPAWFGNGSKVDAVGVSAGASTPQFLVEEVLHRLKETSGGTAETILLKKADTNR